MLFEFSIDLENELIRLLGSYKIIIPESIVRELEFLSVNGNGKKKMKAKASLKFIKKYDTINTDEKNGDNSIIELANKIHCVVVTNDRQLRNRLKDISIPVIYLRAKKKLVMD